MNSIILLFLGTFLALATAEGGHEFGSDSNEGHHGGSTEITAGIGQRIFPGNGGPSYGAPLPSYRAPLPSYGSGSLELGHGFSSEHGLPLHGGYSHSVGGNIDFSLPIVVRQPVPVPEAVEKPVVRTYPVPHHVTVIQKVKVPYVVVNKIPVEVVRKVPVHIPVPVRKGYY